MADPGSGSDKWRQSFGDRQFSLRKVQLSLKDYYEEGFKFAEKATAEDGRGNFELARSCYAESVSHFLEAMALETNQSSKALVSKKIEGFLKRMKELKALCEPGSLGATGAPLLIPPDPHPSSLPPRLAAVQISPESPLVPVPAPGPVSLPSAYPSIPPPSFVNTPTPYEAPDPVSSLPIPPPSFPSAPSARRSPPLPRSPQPPSPGAPPNDDRFAPMVKRAQELLDSAMALEKKGQKGPALKSYQDAATLFLDALEAIKLALSSAPAPAAAAPAPSAPPLGLLLDLPSPPKHDPGDTERDMGSVLNRMYGGASPQPSAPAESKVPEPQVDQYTALSDYANRVRSCVESVLARIQRMKQKEESDDAAATVSGGTDLPFAAAERMRARKSKAVAGSSEPTAASPEGVPPDWQGRKSKAQPLTDEEKKILKRTSTVNGLLFFPFLDQIDDTGEQFNFPEPFTDPDGVLALADKQKLHFAGWKRPKDFSRGKPPRMIDLVSHYSIQQTIITDCSFVASLAVSAYYERRFRKRLITRCIYPKNASGEPVYNPSGKYMIKLKINGVHRKVIVDDRLPVDKNDELLCSFSSNKGELWVSLVEKAFLKVMGGYQFPGSNGGIDLHILTGWIPERISINSDEFNKERTWERMLHGQRFGDCLITTSTSALTAQQEEELGLVPTHAYAVLRVEQLGAVRLLQLKNPWAKKRWRGKYSPEDKASWTEKLRSALDYDRMNALNYDNGVFWIDYDSLCKYYGSIYLNWNPSLFAYRATLHGAWPRAFGPKSDSLNREFCPQYVLSVDVPRDKAPASVWILLSKHVLAKKEEEDEYITLHIYDANKPGRVYYPDDPLIRGTYINNPHYLVRFDAPAGVTSYRIVVSQYEKLYDLFFSLNVYCTAKCVLVPIPHPYPHQEKVTGEWTALTAGGCANYPETFLNNPQFSLSVPTRTSFMLKLEAPRDYSVNVQIFWLPADSPTSQVASRLRSLYRTSSQVQVADSGPYRKGFCYVELTGEDLAGAGVTFPCLLTVLPSTFVPGQVGPFVLTASSAQCPLGLSLIQ